MLNTVRPALPNCQLPNDWKAQPISKAMAMTKLKPPPAWPPNSQNQSDSGAENGEADVRQQADERIEDVDQAGLPSQKIRQILAHGACLTE